MEASSYAFKRNLEPFEEPVESAGWTITGCVDLVGERRYLTYRTRSEAVVRLEPSVVGLRGASAAALAPDDCLDFVEFAADGARVHLLTRYVAVVDPAAITDDDGERLFAFMLDVVTVFERHRFAAPALGLDTIARDGDRFVLLPTAYIAPPSPGTGAPTAITVLHLQRLCSAAVAYCTARDDRGQGFVLKLADAAEAVRAGRVRTVTGFRRMLFGGGTETARDTRGSRDGERVLVNQVAELLTRMGTIEITGPSGSGKSALLDALARELENEGTSVCTIDAWDVSLRARRRGAATRACVWLVDDLDSSPLVYADVLDHLRPHDGDEVSRLVFAVDPAQMTPACASLLQSIKHRSGHGYHVLTLEEKPAPGGKLDDAVEGLIPAERQLLEFVTVAGIPLPHDVIASVFPGTEALLHKHVHHLASLDLVVIDYRPMPPSSNVAAVVRVPSASQRRSLYQRVPEARRRDLHRTIARVAEARGGFPALFLYSHLRMGGEAEAAAKLGAAFLRDSTPEQRAPHVDNFVAEIVEEGHVDSLSLADSFAVFLMLGGDLFARGRRDDAERLLLRARDIDIEHEQMRRHAPTMAEVARLLADIWAARGNYTPALELLDETRDILSPHLSLAEQAQLLNEIGWLQYRLGNYDASVDSCKLSLNTLNPYEHPIIVAQALNLMGVINYNTSHYDEAISYYEQSAGLREREDAQNALAGSFNNLALAYQSKGEYDKALDYYNRSIDIKKRQNNESGIAAGCLNMALLYLEVHNFEEAERKCLESLQISTDLGLAQLAAENHSSLGDIAYTRGRLDEAEAYYRKSLGIARSLATMNEEMGAQRRLAKLFLARDRYDDAREAIEDAARLGNQIGSKYENAQIENVRGDLAMETGNAAEAIDHFEKAANSYAQVSKYRMAAAALAKVGLAHAAGDNPLEAKHYFDRAQDAIKSDIGHEIPDEIVTLQQTLREQPVRSSRSGTEMQKLLYAFYELGSLAEYADEKSAFFKRVITVFEDLTAATSCTLALQTEEGTVTMVAADGEHVALIDPGLRQLFARALQLGTLLQSRSPEIDDIASAINLPGSDGFVCIPMKSMGRSLGCVLLRIPTARLPLTKEDVNFITTIGRHVAGDLRLTFHLEEHAHKEETLEKEFESLKAQVVDRYRFQNMIGKDESMKRIFRILDKIKDMDTGILIIGESGTGKTELARTIHYNSPRRKRHFQQLHCAEIPINLLESELFGHERGAFTGAAQRKLGRCEVADGGTIFLDDVNVMPIETQAKLLHYLESKSFTRLGGTQKITTNVRIIAASNEDLEELAKKGLFREDLFYRLKVIQVELPPLRERPDDLVAIAQEFLKKRCQAQSKPLKTLSSETMKLFHKYRWPGNVRELQNLLEQIVLLCDEDIVAPSSLPADFLKKAAAPGRLQRQSLETLAQQVVETENYSVSNPLMPQLEALLAAKMAQFTSNKSKAASLLGITKPTLYNRLRGYEKLR